MHWEREGQFRFGNSHPLQSRVYDSTPVLAGDGAFWFGGRASCCFQRDLYSIAQCISCNPSAFLAADGDSLLHFLMHAPANGRT